MSKKAFTEVDEFGRPILKETHQIAEAQKEKNSRLKAAFGIKDSFVEGSSFDRKALEEATNQMAKKYDIVPMEDPKPAKKKKKTKKKDTSPSSSSSSSSDSEEEKRKQKLKRKAPSPSTAFRSPYPPSAGWAKTPGSRSRLSRTRSASPRSASARQAMPSISK